MTRTAAEQKKEARHFVKKWAKDVKEDGNTAPFWLSLLGDVLGMEHPEDYISFEDAVKHEEKGSSLFVDARISATRVIIEQKNSDAPLDKKYMRHGRRLTPYEQAFEYDQTQPVDQRARYIIVCNFHEFWIYDMNEPEAFRKPIKLELQDIPEHYDQLNFLVDKASKPTDIKEVKVSVKAGELVGKLYDALHAQYKNPKAAESQRSLNVLCVRIVFCLYAEDAGILGGVDQFRTYLEGWNWQNARDGLIQLFKVLDTKKEDRDPYLREDLATFPYVNGGLFSDEHIEVPRITEKIYHIICDDMSRGFDWSAISPTIFGAVFESTLNPETRRKGGMHYTSIENIHKVVDPLFLDDLKKEFNTIVSVPYEQKFITRRKEITMRADYRRKLLAFQERLAHLTFLDPACGSGNFLTETFLSLRRLENKVINELLGKQQVLDVIDPIKVSISQFYGIEINDFAVTVAKTALWIAESQMMQETEDIIHKELDFLPLKTNANIHEGNALRIDWNDIIPASQLSYIMGNPPFVGYTYQDEEQKEDIKNIWVDEKGKPYKACGKLDYVSCWYFKAAQYMQKTFIRAAFVSTNSITQGEQVASIWKPLMERFGINIDFAWRTFRWDSEASVKAHVHVVIVGFSHLSNKRGKVIYDGEHVRKATNINPYLIDALTVFIESRTKPICNVPQMTTGNRPADGGALIIKAEDYEPFIRREPGAQKYIKKLIGSEEFINGKKRYCLWLVGALPKDLKDMPLVMQRIQKCKENRLKGAPDRQKLADTPTIFRETKNPKQYVLIPATSSETRKYVPMGFLSKDTIPTNSAIIIEEAGIYAFGILESNVHMVWMRTVAGRLKSDYRYSKNIVYNNFPWPDPTPAQKARIEKTAQGILDARKLYPNDSLAALYDDLTMPQELRKAHQENDKAVMEAYGFNWRTMTEPECVQELMKMYVKLTEAENARQGKVTKYRKPKTESTAYPMAAEHSATYGKKE